MLGRIARCRGPAIIEAQFWQYRALRPWMNICWGLKDGIVIPVLEEAASVSESPETTPVWGELGVGHEANRVGGGGGVKASSRLL